MCGADYRAPLEAWDWNCWAENFISGAAPPVGMKQMHFCSQYVNTSIKHKIYTTSQKFGIIKMLLHFKYWLTMYSLNAL